MPPKQAVNAVHRLTFTETFEPIEYVDSIYPGDRFPIYIGRQRINVGFEERV
jgi:DNA-binding GntR family transcriptional regulator